MKKSTGLRVKLKLAILINVLKLVLKLIKHCLLSPHDHISCNRQALRVDMFITIYYWVSEVQTRPYSLEVSSLYVIKAKTLK